VKQKARVHNTGLNGQRLIATNRLKLLRTNIIYGTKFTLDYACVLLGEAMTYAERKVSVSQTLLKGNPSKIEGAPSLKVSNYEIFGKKSI
jgi:hypothetical protein